MGKRLIGSVGLASSGVPDDLLTTKGDTHGYSSTNARIPIGDDDDVLTADSSEALGLKWSPPSASGTLLKVTKSYTDVSALDLPIYTLPATQALVNVFTDVTTGFDSGSTAVTIGDSADPNGFCKSSDWTSTGLTSATRGAYVLGFQGMRSTSSTTSIIAYGINNGGSTFTQSSTDSSEELDPGGGDTTIGRSQIGQRYEAGQVLIGEDVFQATFYISSPSETSTGTFNAYIRNGLGVFRRESTNSFDASTLTSSFVAHTFNFSPYEMQADDMIFVSFQDGEIGSAVIKVATNNGNITDGEEWEQYNGTYQQKEVASLKQIISYDPSSLTQGAVDFYLQIAKQ